MILTWVFVCWVSDFQRYQALQGLFLLSDQWPLELMDRMLMLLPEDKKPEFFFWGLFMGWLPDDVRSNLLTESINNPQRQAIQEDNLWTLGSKSSAVHALSDEYLHYVNTVPLMVWNQHLRCPHSSNPSYGSSECWYHQLWGDEATQLRAPCSYLGN